MIIKGAIASPVPEISGYLKDKIEMVFTYALSEHEAKVLYIGLEKLSTQIEEEKVANMPEISCIFTKDGEISMAIDSEDLLAVNTNRLCIYAIERWREIGGSDILILMVFLEELCHVIWNITDEIKVKYKVFDILKRIWPDFKIEDIYKL
ncbi:hypothetical protein [Clostridium magnum]|uniref:Uncharacterized protein n=1 Tax=Clostridium magnum DSM 2767 TaxID=1121326 RepID=A0A161WUC7_9CLOT|nr:hypothetical protein [Clostridium magnum]KZL90498.1 hypothetical protein CLMAG_42690 [Clostridium magnum DSM 2767]SHH86798.1 hypothetical protein SAMN02745944_01646 [Clostridium magnum DSM 2767]